MENGGKKLSYDELNNVCSQLSLQSQKLAEDNKCLKSEIEEVYRMFKVQKLEFLLNIINNDSAYFTQNFKEYCAKCAEELVNEVINFNYVGST